jgi:hypothetical protein
LRAVVALEILRYIAFTLVICAAPSIAQTTDDVPAEELTEDQIAEEEAIAADSDGSLDDATSSIDVEKIVEGIGFSTDLRLAYAGTDVDFGSGLELSENTLLARWRLRSEIGVAPFMRVVGRVAGICSTEECSPNFVLEDSIPTRSGMDDGDITIDEAYVHWYRAKRFDLAVGRMQTKFVARGGVFAKSLDRNDSHNTNVNWTDGLHATIRAKNGWTPHLILQRNSSDGPTNVRRAPLDFNDSSARVTYFLGIENLERTPLFLQRGIDLTVMPKSLLKDGDLSGRREDYYAIAVRSANRWPERNEGIRLRVAAEVGYAPNTQTKSAEGLTGEGDVDGFAWNAAISLMDFKPNHSIGINYGRLGAGWLISPQYRNNETLTEIRYQWRRRNGLALDFRVRWREEIEELALSDSRRREVDFFLRITRGWTLR